MSKRKQQKNRTIVILQHTVEYWFINDDKYVDGVCLNDCDTEHIEACIKNGYNQGELCNCSDGETEERGWWKIV